jgi:hypothetical protein
VTGVGDPTTGPGKQEATPRGRRGIWLRRAIFGDWSPILRDPLDLARLSFAAFAVVFFLAGSLEYGVRFAGTFVLVAAAQRFDLPRTFDLIFILGMALQVWGNALNLFDVVDWWDNLVHLVVPFSAVPVLYVVNVRLGILSPLAEEHEPRQRLGIVLFAVMAGLTAGVLYEIYEYIAVEWLGATYLEIGYADTILDLALDAVGAFAGGLFLVLWSTRRWETGRRHMA